MSLIVLAMLAAQPMAFDEAVQRALESHPALRVATAEAARATAQVDQARAASLPTLGVNAVGTRLDADRVLGDRVIAGANQLGANLQLQVPLVAAHRWAQWRRAGVNADAVKASAADVRRQVAMAAGRVWLQVLAQQRVVVAATRALDVSGAHLQHAKDRRTAGLGSELDEIRAAQEVAVARQQRATAQGTLLRFEEMLGVAVGLDGAVSARDEEPSLQVPAAALEAAGRTDVRAALARLDAAKEGTAWDWSDYTPLLTAVVQPGYQNPATLTVPLWSFQAQLVLSLPLYDGGLRYGQQRERRALAQQAAAQLEAVQRQASAELRAALAQVTQADEALAAARDAATQAGRTLDLAQQAFRAGASTNLEVVDAERRSRDAETAVALAEDGSRQARLEVLASSGRFPLPAGG
ncbi:MAG: TolC family protein [Archangium sp.]|nr:TolC family protein [Archangium sp.]